MVVKIEIFKQQTNNKNHILVSINKKKGNQIQTILKSVFFIVILNDIHWKK